MVGNALEWYDFAIYGFLATYIARNFFPQDDPTAGVLAAFTVFAIGYVMRPLGGIVIGHIGDRFSRRVALILSISLMSVSTFLIGILPGHATLGIAAPICLTLIRVLQGLSAGGDSSSSAVFLIENADQRRRGLYGSFITIGNLTGILLGSATPIVVSSLISTTAMDSWGWRLPFLLGSVIGIVGYVLRRQIEVDARRGPAASAPVVEGSNGRKWDTSASAKTCRAPALPRLALWQAAWRRRRVWLRHNNADRRSQRDRSVPARRGRKQCPLRRW